ncbi:MAG: glycosyltransferase family 9 protein [Proteobacteria bacterium]|nr:glycosyltransferase family 9 protein [Pseudomonadota bacterium]
MAPRPLEPQLCVTSARPPQRILVIALRRLGDVLLATALIRSLRRAWPHAHIEVLVEAGSQAMLEGNPDVAQVHVQPRHRRQALALARRLWRRFDLAVSAHSGDRSHLWALVASGWRVGVVPPPGLPGARWKRWSCQAWTEMHLGDLHTVEQYLRLADAMGIARCTEVVAPDAPAALERPEAPYAVLHPTPQFAYKEWTVEGWRALAAHLVQRGLRVVLSQGPGERDRQLVEAIRAGMAERERARLDMQTGRGTLAELAALLRGARLYVGADTSVTHLAAAVGTPTIALFGPSPTVEWGPWPVGGSARGAASPWQLKAPLQHAGNVWLLQGEGDCVPCLKEGCDRHRGSRSRCLDEMPPRRVIVIADEILSRPAQA